MMILYLLLRNNYMSELSVENRYYYINTIGILAVVIDF